jgi:hypothetical protein
MVRSPRTRKESGGKNGLTPIPHRIHCPATTDWVGGKDELEQMQVDHFLDTLAEVALAVASRRRARDRPDGEVDPCGR